MLELKSMKSRISAISLGVGDPQNSPMSVLFGSQMMAFGMLPIGKGR